MAAMRIGIDTGGTFTDVVVVERGRLRVHKVPSTPDDPARAVLSGLADVRDGRRPVDVVHGTTVGLNAVLTGRLARTAFVTNEGFLDLCEIGRQERADIYALEARRPELPVPRQLRFTLPTRRSATGEALRRPTRASIAELAARLGRARVESVAIGFLHSYRHPEDEREVADRLGALGVPITCSAELLPVHGEFERFTAAILNAAIQPIMGAYLERLRAGVEPGRVRLMRSSGGIMPAAEASQYPARAVFSGPAGGVLATARLAHALGVPSVAALDMGGTSTDVALCNAKVEGRTGSVLAGLPLALPAVDVHTVGCGGGSIAYADVGGALRVGPESAGADPGPACYGRGDDATVTDAHLALGHLGADTLLGGAFPVDPGRSVRAIERLARRLGMSPRRCAEGILEVAEVAMMRALLVITVERAVDPASVPLVAFGGAGGLHAAGLATRLGMPCAIVPADPGAFSAVGLALAGESMEALRPLLQRLDQMAAGMLQRELDDLAHRARADLEREAPGGGPVLLTKAARVRYAGQGYGLWVPCGKHLARSFQVAHERQFGFVPDAPVEVVELRVRAQRGGRRMVLGPVDSVAPSTARAPAAIRRRRPPLGGAPLPVYARGSLRLGARLRGPCMIEELTCATRVPAGAHCRVVRGGLELSRSR